MCVCVCCLFASVCVVRVCVLLHGKPKNCLRFQQSNQQKAKANSRATAQWNCQSAHMYATDTHTLAHTHTHTYEMARMKAYILFQSQTLSRCVQNVFIN